MKETTNLNHRDGYFDSLGLKKMTPQIPVVADTGSNGIFDREAILAECDLIDTFSVWHKKLTKNSLDEYRILAEVYAAEYDKHYNDISTMNAVDGVLVEMYSDIFKHERLKGENERSIAQKERIFVIKNGIECLKKYITKYEQAKVSIKISALERTKLIYENQKLKAEIERVKKSYEEL